MIGRATDCMEEDFVVSADADDVVPEFRSERWRDAWGAIFGREDYVRDILNVGVSHNDKGNYRYVYHISETGESPPHSRR